MTLPDVKTLILCAALTNYYMCGGLYVYGKSQKTYPGFGYWMIATIMVAFTYTLFMLRGIAPDWLTIPVANTIVMASAIFRIEGIKRFIGREKFNYWSFCIPALTFIWYSYFTFVEDSIVLRNAWFTVLTLMIAIWLIILLRANPWAEKKAITNFFIGAIIVYSIFLFTRAVGMFLDPDSQALTANTPFNSIYFLVVLFFDISWAVCFILLNGQRMELELNHLTAQLDKIASTDALTGIYNRRKFLELGEIELARAQRYGHSLSVLMFDLDQFKDVNDTYGHPAGDEVLQKVIQACQKNLRQTDLIGRFGGDEFVILMPETELETTHEISERLSSEIQKIPFAWARDLKIAISYGAAQWNRSEYKLDDLLAQADVFLYDMKYKRRGISPIHRLRQMERQTGES